MKYWHIQYQLTWWSLYGNSHIDYDKLFVAEDYPSAIEQIKEKLSKTSTDGVYNWHIVHCQEINQGDFDKMKRMEELENIRMQEILKKQMQKTSSDKSKPKIILSPAQNNPLKRYP